MDNIDFQHDLELLQRFSIDDVRRILVGPDAKPDEEELNDKAAEARIQKVIESVQELTEWAATKRQVLDHDMNNIQKQVDLIMNTLDTHEQEEQTRAKR